MNASEVAESAVATEEFYEDGSVTRAGVATTMKTTTTMGI